jgi:hypothetical protein
MSRTELALRAAELLLRVVAPLLRRGGERIDAADIDARRQRLRGIVARRRRR